MLTKSIIWDNICAHIVPYATNITEDRQSPNHFPLIDRLLYCPKLAMIEYIFGEGRVEVGMNTGVDDG